MKIKTIGAKNGGRPLVLDMPEGSTVQDVADRIDVTASSTTFLINGLEATSAANISDGDLVTYVMKNIKGA